MLNRKLFISALGAGAVGCAWMPGKKSGMKQAMLEDEQMELHTEQIPPLGYDQSALEPHISGRTLSFHYGKHHQGYLNKLKKHLDGSKYQGKSVEDIMKASAGREDETQFFNNAAQVWNHAFYWRCMTPRGGGEPVGVVAARLRESFGGYQKFREAITDAAGVFGSGWAWLVEEPDGSLSTMGTSNADNPIVHGKKPLLTIDVWEHAYYLDYQNRRGDYVQAFLDNLVNWEFVAAQLG